jgi:hypothetical protein
MGRKENAKINNEAGATKNQPHRLYFFSSRKCAIKRPPVTLKLSAAAAKFSLQKNRKSLLQGISGSYRGPGDCSEAGRSPSGPLAQRSGQFQNRLF